MFRSYEQSDHCQMHSIVKKKLQKREGSQRLFVFDQDIGELKDIGAIVPSKNGKPMLVLNPLKDEPNGIYTIAKKDVINHQIVVDVQGSVNLINPDETYQIAICIDGQWETLGICYEGKIEFGAPIPRESKNRSPVMLFPIK